MLELIELLLMGMNPQAAGPLTDAEAPRVRAALRPDESLESLVRGRVVGAGASLWVLTEQRLLLLQARGAAAVAVDLAAVQGLGVEAGRYGATLTLRTLGAVDTIYAADVDLTLVFAAALRQKAPHADIVMPTPPAALLPADAKDAVLQSRLRLLPSLRHDAGTTVVVLREAAALRASGVLDEAEFSAIKGRLLAAA